MSQPLQDLLHAYVEHLSIRQFSATTIRTRSVHLRGFVDWCDRHDANSSAELSPALLTHYQAELITARKLQGDPLCISTRNSYLSTIRAWVRWMGKSGIVSPKLEAEIALPKPIYRLPRFLSAAEIEQVFAGCSLRTKTGLRDRAMLETLYSSGVRRTELLRLRTHDLDWHKELITIRLGKGQKDRIIPIGERALAWIDRYLWEFRPCFLHLTDDHTVFLTSTGRTFSPNHLSALVRTYIKRAHPQIEGACHVFRHSMATLMLEGGADIRFIQQMLGHSKLSTTQIYAHVSVKALKEVHSKTHPGARLRAFTKEALHLANPGRMQGTHAG